MVRPLSCRAEMLLVKMLSIKVALYEISRIGLEINGYKKRVNELICNRMQIGVKNV